MRLEIPNKEKGTGRDGGKVGNNSRYFPSLVVWYFQKVNVEARCARRGGWIGS